MRRWFVYLLLFLSLLHTAALFGLGIAWFGSTLLAYYLAWRILRYAAERIPAAEAARLVRLNIRNLLALLLLAEFTCTYIIRLGNTFHENTYGIFVSEYKRDDLVRFMRLSGFEGFRLKPIEGYAPGTSSEHRTGEFQYPTTYNRLGLRGQLPDTNAPGFRLLILGDSFVEGYGAPEDSTLPVLLEQELKQRYNLQTAVLNAGICGSDPLQAMALYRAKLADRPADLVLLYSNLSDLYDIEHTLHRESMPAAEYFLAISHIYRLIHWGLLHHDMAQATTSERMIRKRTRNLQQLADSLRVFQATLEHKQTGFALIYHPTLVELTDPDNYRPTDALPMAYQANSLPLIDMRAAYRRQFPDTLQWQAYYWKRDGHHNSQGYAQLARLTAEALHARGLLPPVLPDKSAMKTGNAN